jgi:hypothetical protein
MLRNIDDTFSPKFAVFPSTDHKTSEEQDLPLVPRGSPSHAAILRLTTAFGGQSPATTYEFAAPACGYPRCS